MYACKGTPNNLFPDFQHICLFQPYRPIYSAFHIFPTRWHSDTRADSLANPGIWNNETFWADEKKTDVCGGWKSRGNRVAIHAIYNSN